MELRESTRLSLIKEYPFEEINQIKARYPKEYIIDLSIGDPDLTPPENVLEALKSLVDKSYLHGYATYEGEYELRKSICEFYTRIYKVNLDPERQALVLIGTKEGIAHLPWALLNPKDYCIVPELGYPVYERSVVLAGAKVYKVKLKAGLVDISSIPNDIAKKAKILFVNYPNNPTAYACELSFFKELVEFAKKNDILICHDGAYLQIYFDENKKPRSILEVAGATDIACEFYSLSKTYNMAGWRVGFLLGNEKAIKILLKLKTNIDSGVFKPIQYASCKALEPLNDEFIKKNREIYRTRRDIVINALSKYFYFDIPQATFYVWIKIPDKFDNSFEFAKALLEHTGVIVTPGEAFGEEAGKHYFRLSLTQDISKIKEAMERIVDWQRKM